MDTAALVDRMVDSYNRHDIDALAACYAPGARVNGGGWPEDIDATAWLAGLGTIFDSFPDLQLHPHNLVADGRVTAERHFWPFAQVFVQLGLVGSPRPS